MQILRTVLKVLNVVITAALMLAIAISTVLTVSARRSGDGVPMVAGHKVLNVLSGSMEPAIRTGDVIVIRPATDAARDVKDGDIITFRSRENASLLITHRVVGITRINERPAAFTTKGDANPSADPTLVLPEQVVGRYQWRAPYFGYVASFLRKPVGIILLVILPGLILIGLEFRKMWQTLREAEKAKAAAAEGQGGGEA